MAALARKAAARADIDPACLRTFSALARRLGAYQDAIAWCEAAEKLEKTEGKVTQPTLITLGYAYRDAGQPARAIEAWRRGAELRPKNTALLLDLTDITHAQGDVDQSLNWAKRAAASDRSGVKARAALLAARYRAGGRAAHECGDAAQLTELVDLALAHPDVPYLSVCLSRACEGATWLRTVPVPTEAVAQMFGHLVETEESGQKVTRVTSQSTTLEAPTPMALLRARFPQSTITVPQPPEPDPRVPLRTDFGTPLWSYSGIEATATVDPPSPQAVELVHAVATGVWADPLVAFERAADFAKLGSADLLGLLAHMPPPRDPAWVEVQRRYPLYWERFAQAWVCLGILHHRPDEPWARSARRTLLLRLLSGPDDWTVDAAAFALCVAAWRGPGQRAEIADVIAQRYRYAARAVGKSSSALHDPLAQVVLICPDVDPKTARLARKNLAGRVAPGGSGLRRWTRRG